MWVARSSPDSPVSPQPLELHTQCEVCLAGSLENAHCEQGKEARAEGKGAGLSWPRPSALATTSITRCGSLATATTGLGEALPPMPRSTFVANGAGVMSPENRSRRGPPARGGDRG